MGRELKRVALDFNWPLDKIWPGFVNPFWDNCHSCPQCEKEYSETCSLCGGTEEVFDTPQAKASYEAWEDYEPPTGDGYQIWETVSEGSPVSPVFDTPEKLAGWMVQPGNDRSITNDTTYEQWLAWIKGSGFACSMVIENGVMKNGVVAAVESQVQSHEAKP